MDINSIRPQNSSTMQHQHQKQDSSKPSQDSTARSTTAIRPQSMAVQGYGPLPSPHQHQQAHIAPGYDHIYCQCGCGAPLEAASSVHAQQAAGARQHQTTHSAHHAPAHPFLGSAAAGAGMMHPHMYAGTYAGPHDMAHQQFQSQFAAAAAAMNQYTTFNRGMADLDPYRSPHMQHFRSPMELPRGYMMSAAPNGATYLAPGAQLNYFRQYPGMMHMVAAAGGENRVGSAVADQNSAAVPAAAAGVSAAGSGATSPPEAAPPPPHGSPTASQRHQQQQLPKESILSSLLAARSERLSAASAEDREAHGSDKQQAVTQSPRGPEGGSEPTAGVATAAGDQRLGPTNTHEGVENKSAVMSPKMGPVGVSSFLAPHQQLAHSPVVTGSPHGGPELARGAGGASAAAAAMTAATAMHLTGLRGGFPTGMHALGGMSGMAPPITPGAGLPTGPNPPAAQQMAAARLQAHRSPTDATTAMNAMQYMGTAAAAAAAAASTGMGMGMGTGTGPVGGGLTSPGGSSMAFTRQDAVEENMRQQEKKLQKRAANRKSAQLSRKRKKALIEELKYENQDLQRHEDILEVIPDPVFAFDTANGGVWFASNSASAQFGLPVEDLMSASFFDLMTEDCSKRLRVLIETATKDISDTGSTLLHERMTVRFKKRKAAILLGELSGRLSRQGDSITAVCSVRPLSLATDDIVGKGYYGDASVSELAEDTAGDQGSSSEDSPSGGTGVTSSTADSSSGLGTGCTSMADEGSSSVPSLSSLEVKRSRSDVDGGGGGGGSSGSAVSGSGSIGGGENSRACPGGSTGDGSNGSEECGAYNSDSPSSGGCQDGFDEPTNTDSDCGDGGGGSDGDGGGGSGGEQRERSAERFSVVLDGEVSPPVSSSPSSKTGSVNNVTFNFVGGNTARSREGKGARSGSRSENEGPCGGGGGGVGGDGGGNGDRETVAFSSNGKGSKRRARCDDDCTSPVATSPLVREGRGGCGGKEDERREGAPGSKRQCRDNVGDTKDAQGKEPRITTTTTTTTTQEILVTRFDAGTRHVVGKAVGEDEARGVRVAVGAAVAVDRGKLKTHKAVERFASIIQREDGGGGEGNNHVP